MRQQQIDFDQIFQQIYEEWYVQLCHYAFRFTKDEDDAEDIVQKTIIKLWDKREQINHIDSLKAYVFRMVYNAAVNHIEHLRVIDRHKSDALYELSLLEFEDDTSIDEERQILVNDALKQLPEKNQEVFRLRYIKGMKHKEIAEKLNISSRTVETHILQGLKKIRSFIKQATTFLFFLYVVIIFHLL